MRKTKTDIINVKTWGTAATLSSLSKKQLCQQRKNKWHIENLLTKDISKYERQNTKIMVQ